MLPFLLAHLDQLPNRCFQTRSGSLCTAIIAEGCQLPLAAFVGNDATLHESTLASGTRHAAALDAPRSDAARLALYLP